MCPVEVGCDVARKLMTTRRGEVTKAPLTVRSTGSAYYVVAPSRCRMTPPGVTSPPESTVRSLYVTRCPPQTPPLP